MNNNNDENKPNSDKSTSDNMNLQMRWKPEFVRRIDAVLEKIRTDFPNLSRHDFIFKWVSERLKKEEKKR